MCFCFIKDGELSFKGFSGSSLFTALCSTTPVNTELVHELLYFSDIKCPFHCTSPFSEWHRSLELIDYSGLNILVAFLKATSCWRLDNNLHTLISPYWLHYTPSAREDLWLNYTSRHISLPSILDKPCQWSASIAVQLIVFSGLSLVEALQSNRLKYQCKLASIKNNSIWHSPPAWSFQTWHIIWY